LEGGPPPPPVRDRPAATPDLFLRPELQACAQVLLAVLLGLLVVVLFALVLPSPPAYGLVLVLLMLALLDILAIALILAEAGRT
jgi:hypothetical protein